MSPNEKDRSYLWDIIDACNDISDFTKNLTFHEFAESKIVRFAVERQLLMIGEAANHLSENFRLSEPDIPWKQMIGLRNIIAHEYGEILAERIWKISKQNIPLLKEKLKQFKHEF